MSVVSSANAILSPGKPTLRQPYCWSIWLKAGSLNRCSLTERLTQHSGIIQNKVTPTAPGCVCVCVWIHILKNAWLLVIFSPHLQSSGRSPSICVLMLVLKGLFFCLSGDYSETSTAQDWRDVAVFVVGQLASRIYCGNMWKLQNISSQNPVRLCPVHSLASYQQNWVFIHVYDHWWVFLVFLKSNIHICVFEPHWIILSFKKLLLITHRM